MVLQSNIHQVVVGPNSVWFRCPGLLWDALGCLLSTWSNYQEHDSGFTSLLQLHKQLLPAVICTFSFLVLYAPSICVLRCERIWVWCTLTGISTCKSASGIPDWILAAVFWMAFFATFVTSDCCQTTVMKSFAKRIPSEIFLFLFFSCPALLSLCCKPSHAAALWAALYSFPHPLLPSLGDRHLG